MRRSPLVSLAVVAACVVGGLALLVAAFARPPLKPALPVLHASAAIRRQAPVVQTVIAAATVPAPSCTPGRRVETTNARARILYVTDDIVAHVAPSNGSAVIERLGRTNVYGLGTTLLALTSRVGADCTPRWYEVKLPAKPNGVVGWIPAHDVVPDSIDTRIVASLSQRSLTLYRGGHPLLRLPVAIGASATPTPTGYFYVDSRFKLRDVGSPYGPAVLGIAAYSNAPQGWARGNPIAIHGTNDDSSIGSAASHGCLRVHNRDVLRLLSLVPTGTPVEIRA